MPNSAAPGSAPGDARPALEAGEIVYLAVGVHRGWRCRVIPPATQAETLLVRVTDRLYAPGVPNRTVIAVPAGSDVRRLDQPPGTTATCRHCRTSIRWTGHRVPDEAGIGWAWTHTTGRPQRTRYFPGTHCPAGTPYYGGSPASASPAPNGYAFAPLPLDLLAPDAQWMVTISPLHGTKRTVYRNAHTVTAGEVLAEAFGFTTTDTTVLVTDPYGADTFLAGLT